MKRRFTDEQIIGMIKEYEAGVKAANCAADMASAMRRFTSTKPGLVA